VVATEMLLVIGLLAFVGLALGAQKILGLSDPVHMSVPLALVLSGVPAILWLGYFYLQDRHEPEPKHYVAGVYLLGAFGAARFAQFIQRDLLPTHETTLAGVSLTADHILRAILVVGLAQEFAKFIVVRYTIYLSDEFDEPMDGIIYMTAAGIGFATAENIDYLTGIGGVFLAVGAANAVVTTMAHACFAGVLGYALGRAKFASGSGQSRNMMLLGGLTLAAVLNGVFNILEEKVVSAGLSVEPWRGLAFASGFAVIVFMGTSVLMQRNLAISPHKAA
jgi:RsiW-degrading membrane proteinase PrsW (M82 family)